MVDVVYTKITICDKAELIEWFNCIIHAEADVIWNMVAETKIKNYIFLFTGLVRRNSPIEILKN